MKTQIVYIHGGTAYRNYEMFLENLRTEPIDDFFGILKRKKWKETLREEFGSTCDVFYPSMPNTQNARYIEWKIWFERYFELINGEIILIGHSQGAYFLAKYLSENQTPFPIRKLYLVAAPFEPDNFGGEDGGDFNPDPSKLVDIYKNTENIVIYHSKDDDCVPYSHGEKYHIALPKAEYILFKDRGHFNSPTFPEIIEDIQKLLQK